MDFHNGDLVQICTKEEAEENGLYIEGYCAVTCYAGSVCEVVHEYGDQRFQLSVVKLVENYDPVPHELHDIDFYHWKSKDLKPVEQCIYACDEGFEDIF